MSSTVQSLKIRYNKKKSSYEVVRGDTVLDTYTEFWHANLRHLSETGFTFLRANVEVVEG